MQEKTNENKNLKTEQQLRNIQKMALSEDKCKEIAAKIVQYIKDEKS